jgi:hypothetical protein
MNDNDVPGMPDTLEIKITDSYRLREEARRRYARRWATFKEAG